MTLEVRTPDHVARLAELCYDDFGRLCRDGLGIMLTDEQLEARQRIGAPGPRMPGERKMSYLSGGQRAGKTVLGWLMHADACLYKRGVDPTNRFFIRNYQYGALHVAPTDELALRMWTIADEVQKGTNDAQWDPYLRKPRRGAFLHKFKAGKSGQHPIVRFTNGAHVDFRSTEGYAYRLEGGQWWWIEWDEWMSQPDREIQFVLTEVLMGRGRDHDAKIVPMAWPKAATERHLIEAARRIDAGLDIDSQVIYLSAERAFFTNPEALATERRVKSEAQWRRTVLGEPAGGASLVFKPDDVANMLNETLPETPSRHREDGHTYLSSFDIALAHDATVGLAWRIPIVDGRPLVNPDHKARIVAWDHLPGAENLSLDDLFATIHRMWTDFGGMVAVDATAMGGVGAFRALREGIPSLLAFSSRSNDRIHGNMRLAAITNGLDCLTWRDESAGPDAPWGLVEMPRIVELIDQLANFDPDDKKIADDWVWAFLIGLWYIRRYWVAEHGLDRQQPFRLDRRAASGITARPGRSPLVPAQPSGVVLIGRRD